jgi:hypothetical protein
MQRAASSLITLLSGATPKKAILALFRPPGSKPQNLPRPKTNASHTDLIHVAGVLVYCLARVLLSSHYLVVQASVSGWLGSNNITLENHFPSASWPTSSVPFILKVDPPFTEVNTEWNGT